MRRAMFITSRASSVVSGRHKQFVLAVAEPFLDYPHRGAEDSPGFQRALEKDVEG
jgi:hypothetical protein